MRDHLQLALADGSGDCVGRGVHGDLKLLVPEFGLVVFDLSMQAVCLEAHLEALLTKLEHKCRDSCRGENAEEEFEHVVPVSV